MKYKCTNEVIPQEMREDINTKIEYIVNNDLPEVETGISKDDIFNAYTGLGGLHGLEFNNYDSYYDYQRAKADIEPVSYTHLDVYKRQIYDTYSKY